VIPAIRRVNAELRTLAKGGTIIVAQRHWKLAQGPVGVGGSSAVGHIRFFIAKSNSTINAQNNPDAIHKGTTTTNGGSPCDMAHTTERGHEATAQTIVQKYSKGVGGDTSGNTKNTRKNKPITASVAQTATATNLLIPDGSDMVMWPTVFILKFHGLVLFDCFHRMLVTGQCQCRSFSDKLSGASRFWDS
jgi:hypothetical protein